MAALRQLLTCAEQLALVKVRIQPSQLGSAPRAPALIHELWCVVTAW